MTSWRYEFKKGTGVILEVNYPQPDFCVYRNTLLEGHEQCGVQVYDLITGPIRNPMFEIFENHTKLSPLSMPSVPEEGGICKYIHPSAERYCLFCKQEATAKREETRKKKEMKKIDEINYLLNNIHRFRGAKKSKK